MIKKRFTLSKEERLKSRKRIDQLFSKGQSFVLPPYRTYYLFETHDAANLQAGFGVSSRLFKKAVDRNRIKRLTREAYRLQKHGVSGLLKEHDLKLSVFLLFTGKEIPKYVQVESKMGLILQRLTTIINEKAAPRH